MTSASPPLPGDHPVSPSAPRQIRSTLVGEELADFDREYRRVLAEAAETLDLTNVLQMLTRWQRVAWSTQQDPGAHRRMLAHADQLNAGDQVATETWQHTKAALGL